MKLLVIADDFTGALDTGVQFAGSGIATMVAPDRLPDFAAIPPEVQALVVNTESRHMPPAGAADAVGRLAAAAATNCVPYIYKKTDSTLRGNVGVELKAVMDACGGSPAVFVPAFPQAGRTTVNGRQLVNGIPLEHTAFAHDPLNPMHTSVIADILRAQADLQVENVQRGSALLRFDGQNTVYVFDAETEEDLGRAGRLLQNAGRLSITAGCAGFARHLSALLPLKHSTPEKPRLPGSILLVCGSVNETSLRQMEHAEELGFERLIPEADRLTEGYWDTDAGQAVVRRAAERLARGGRLAIQSALQGVGRLPVNLSAAIAGSLGALTRGILAQAGPCTLAVFGGDTAMGVMAHAGCTGLMPVREIEPGVALSVMCGNAGNTFLISKAGGLGSEIVLHKIDEFVRGNGA